MVKKPLVLPTKTLASQRAFIKKLKATCLATRVVPNSLYDRKYPKPGDLMHHARVAASVPGFSINEDGEVSARHLTDWYVTKFCAINNLKHG